MWTPTRPVYEATNCLWLSYHCPNSTPYDFATSYIELCLNEGADLDTSEVATSPFGSGSSDARWHKVWRIFTPSAVTNDKKFITHNAMEPKPTSPIFMLKFFIIWSARSGITTFMSLGWCFTLRCGSLFGWQVSLISYHLPTLSWVNDVATSNVSTYVSSFKCHINANV